MAVHQGARVYTRRQQAVFTTVRSEGSILPVDLLQRVAQGDPNLNGLTPEAYNLLKTEKINEAINHSWNRLLSAWAAFKAAQEKLPEKDLGTTLTRERWLLPLFHELGYGRPYPPCQFQGRSRPLHERCHRGNTQQPA